jgi:ammonia channel protein AmtB
LKVIRTLSLYLGSTLWISIGTILVFLMIPAIDTLVSRLIRRKNVVNALMMVFCIPYIL